METARTFRVRAVFVSASLRGTGSGLDRSRFLAHEHAAAVRIAGPRSPAYEPPPLPFHLSELRRVQLGRRVHFSAHRYKRIHMFKHLHNLAFPQEIAQRYNI